MFEFLIATNRKHIVTHLHTRARAWVLGRREREGVGNFVPSTGAGYVSPLDGDYARAQEMGLEVAPLCISAAHALPPGPLFLKAEGFDSLFDSKTYKLRVLREAPQLCARSGGGRPGPGGYVCSGPARR